MEKFVPQVRYEIGSLDMEAELFYNFAGKGRERWRDVINRAYPELIPMLATATDEAEAKNRCLEFARTLHAENKDEIETARIELQSSWDVVGPKYLTILSEHLETEWPIEHPIITGYISVQPIYPRFLNKFSFCVGYNKPIASSVETSAHEILHFLWFKKWKEVFPEMNSTTYESPHLVWRLSEIMDPIILQCHMEIKDLIKPNNWGYRSFADIKIGDISMTDYFKNIYEEAVRSGVPFTEVMRQLWVTIQAHEAEVSGF